MAVVKELPALDRPREKANRFGIESLSDAELLSILLGKGYQGNNAIQISSSLLNKYGGLNALSNVPTKELKKNKGIKDAKALILASIFEIHCRLLTKGVENEDSKINDEYLVEKYHPILSRCNQEFLIVVLLNSRNKIIFENTLYKGSVNMISINFEDIHHLLAVHEAKSYYIIHNHPKGDSTPSEQDKIATNNLFLQSKRLHIKLIDHLIIGHNDYYSFSKMKKTTISC